MLVFLKESFYVKPTTFPTRITIVILVLEEFRCRLFLRSGLKNTYKKCHRAAADGIRMTIEILVRTAAAFVYKGFLIIFRYMKSRELKLFIKNADYSELSPKFW